MTLLYGPIPDKGHLVQFYYLPENIGRPLTKNDYMIIFAHSALIDDDDAIAMLEELPFSTVIIEANDLKPSSALREKPVEKCFGGKGVRLSETVCCLVDCGVYTIDKLKLLVLPFNQAKDNAADKVLYDKHLKMRAKCRRLLQRKNRRVDHVISRLMPYSLIRKKRITGMFDYNSLILDKFIDGFEYRRWYFSHFEYDETFKDRYINVFRAFHLLDKED